MSKQAKDDIQRGHGSEERPLTRVLWERDSMPDHPIITEASDYTPNYREVNYARYYDQEHADKEVKNIWKKQWLYAAREEDLPNIGDRLPFDIATLSFIITRTGESSFKAFYNSCLHRGARLCDKPESGDTIKCPYHGWTWNVDGSLNRIPGHWDFPELSKLNASLREVSLECWGGMVFINADPNCAPLSETLNVMPEHFKCYAPENRYTAVHFKKSMRANWKICQEAFQESYHLTTTHPEAVPFNTDSQAQYDVWPTPNGAIGRTTTPGCVPSMAAPPEATCASATEAFMYIMHSWHYPDVPMEPIDPNGDVRAQAVAWHRKAYKKTYGKESAAPDTVLLDSLLYFAFPNWCLWLSEAVPLLYRFLPHETDPQKSYFEVRVLRPIPEGQAAPAPSPCVIVSEDEVIQDKVEGLNFLALVFEQDTSNMPLVQKGVRSADPTREHAVLGRYQEIVLQHWNDLVENFT